MPRSEIDWSVLERAVDGSDVPPEVEFKERIDAEAGRVEGIIAYCDDQRSTTTNRLVSFASDSDPEDYYVRCSALLRTFGHYSLLGTYFEETNFSLVEHRETGVGWVRRLRNPKNNTGVFRITFTEVEGAGTTVSRTTVSYAARES